MHAHKKHTWTKAGQKLLNLAIFCFRNLCASNSKKEIYVHAYR
jgi:hypothetical protein